MTPEQIHAIQRKYNSPDNEVPGAVPFAAVLGRNGDVAVAITGVQAYSSGLSFNLAVRLRREDRDNPRALPDAVFGGRFGSSRTDDALLLGVAYPDGRTASNISPRPSPSADTSIDQPSLMPGGGVEELGHVLRGIEIDLQFRELAVAANPRGRRNELPFAAARACVGVGIESNRPDIE